MNLKLKVTKNTEDNMIKIVVLILTVLLAITGCGQTPKVQVTVVQSQSVTPTQVVATPTPTVTSDTTLNTSPAKTLKFSQEIQSYLDDVEAETHRKIIDEQKTLLQAYLDKNKIRKMDTKVTATHRKEFDKIRKELLIEWEQHTG